MVNTQEFVSPRQAAALLKVNRSYIYELLIAQKLCGFKDGDAWRIVANDVERLRTRWEIKRAARKGKESENRP